MESSFLRKKMMVLFILATIVAFALGDFPIEDLSAVDVPDDNLDLNYITKNCNEGSYYLEPITAYLKKDVMLNDEYYRQLVLNLEFEVYKRRFNKKYATLSEESRRKQIFSDNFLNYFSHNRKFILGLVKYTVGINKHSDKLATEERFSMGYKAFLLTQNFTDIDAYNRGYFLKIYKDIVLPDSVDWREKGAVTEVKDQGMCGSCYAFSAAGSLEGMHFRKTGKLVNLSVQDLLDCTYLNHGCDGGEMAFCFMDVMKQGGIDTENSYPYRAERDICKFNPSEVGATDTGFKNIPHGDEEALKQAVATIGPISVAIDVSEDFIYYKNGIYHDRRCKNERVNLKHAVLVVGYGTSEEGDDYWIVKNSWGKNWGDNGYILMARNSNNMCGIATLASYPTI